MSLVKTSLLSFIATSVKMLSLLVINKVVAVTIGPSGVALIGQFQNFSQIAMTVSQGGLNQGVIKYTAEFRDDQVKLSALFSTAFKTALVCSLIVGAFCVFASSYLSQYFLKSNDYEYIFVLFGVLLPLFVINQLLLSILNGLKALGLFISNNIIQSLYGLVVTSLLVWFFGLHGAFIALVTNQSVVLLILVWRLRHFAMIRLKMFLTSYSAEQLKKLGSFTLMALTSAITIPVSHLIIRNHIADNLGWEAAGYWQSIWYISSIYLLVITTVLSIYFLPTISALADRKDIRRELIEGGKIVLPIVCCLSFFLYLLRDTVVVVLFSDEFRQVNSLFFWQLLGDVIKIASWLLGIILIAKAKTKMVIGSEVIFPICFALLSIWLTTFMQLQGVVLAYFITYVLHLFYTLSCVLYAELV